MMEYILPYGHRNLSFRLPDHFHVDWIEPGYTPPAKDPVSLVEHALLNPIEGKGLSSFSGAQSVVIGINDKTRPVPHEILLPPLLHSLDQLGIPAQAITFLIATGTHTPMPQEEFQRILPEEILKTYRVVSHDCDNLDNLVYLGDTQRGTPVWVNKLVQEADLRIVIGNIEPHHFAGFSGGYKTAAIGFSGRKTINQNHSWLVDPMAKIGEFDQNPLRQDIEEIGQMMGIHIAINTVMNMDREIVDVISGAPEDVMRVGIPISRQVCGVTLLGQSLPQYDLVIASVGGAPKDINFYQSQKALTHVSLIAKDGGMILLVAECPEGSGSAAYEGFMQGVQSPQQVFSKFKEMGFRVGPHKAFQVAREAARLKIILLSEISKDLVEHLLMEPANTPEQALEKVFTHLAASNLDDVHVAILPHATNTVPVIKAEKN